MRGLPCGLDFHVVHQLLAAGQPYIGGDNPLMGSQHQHLVFQVVFLAVLYVPPLIQIAPVHARKICGVIDDDRTLILEELIYIKVCLNVNRIA